MPPQRRLVGALLLALPRSCVAAVAPAPEIVCGKNAAKCKKEHIRGGQLVADFLAEFDAAPSGTRAVVFDVGANDGAWSLLWSKHVARAREAGRQLEVVLLEPQPAFTERLTKLAAEHNFTFLAAAAHRSETELTFHTGKASKMGSVNQASAGHSGHTAQVRVRAVDLAARLRAWLPRPGTLSLLKLDVEGLEFSLLPWLLAQGALCLLRYLHIEWHLNSAPAETRLSALALQHSLVPLLEAGCATPPAAVFHEDPPMNNAAVPVPGLAELLATHSTAAEPVCVAPRYGGQPSSWTGGWLRADRVHLDRLREEPPAAEGPLRIRCYRSNNGHAAPCLTRRLELEANYSRHEWQRACPKCS